jgi:hypothetical protein
LRLIFWTLPAFYGVNGIRSNYLPPVRLTGLPFQISTCSELVLGEATIVSIMSPNSGSVFLPCTRDITCKEHYKRS